MWHSVKLTFFIKKAAEVRAMNKGFDVKVKVLATHDAAKNCYAKSRDLRVLHR